MSVQSHTRLTIKRIRSVPWTCTKCSTRRLASTSSQAGKVDRSGRTSTESQDVAISGSSSTTSRSAPSMKPRKQLLLSRLMSLHHQAHDYPNFKHQDSMALATTSTDGPQQQQLQRVRGGYFRLDEYLEHKIKSSPGSKLKASSHLDIVASRGIARFQAAKDAYAYLDTGSRTSLLSGSRGDRSTSEGNSRRQRPSSILNTLANKVVGAEKRKRAFRLVSSLFGTIGDGRTGPYIVQETTAAIGRKAVKRMKQ